MILKKADQRSTILNHFESVGTLDNKVLGFVTIENLGITVLQTARRPWTNFQLRPFGFLMNKIRMLQGLVHRIVSPFLSLLQLVRVLG